MPQPSSHQAASPSSGAQPLLEARGFTAALGSGTDIVTAMRALDLDVRADETVAIVGKSGPERSVTSVAINAEAKGPG